MIKKNEEKMKLKIIFSLAICTVSLTSCVYEGLERCPRGVSLEFVYDYNMEYADGFSSQVDCLTLYVYNEDGTWVGTWTETGDALKAKDYRMVIDLPEGNYRFVAYGGLACGKHSFSVVTEPSEGTAIDGLQVQMAHNGYVSDAQLHDMFWGMVEASVDGELYKDVTLHMMKDTNNIRIVLQQADTGAEPIVISDYDITITDSNWLMAYDNSLVSGTQLLTYEPWSSGDGLDVGDTGDGTYSAAYAEFSLSRLVIPDNAGSSAAARDPRLVIYSHREARTVVDIPLLKYLLLLKSERYSDMGDQEYLDRENLWSIVFLLNDYTWHDVNIIINNWTVRQEDIELQ